MKVFSKRAGFSLVALGLIAAGSTSQAQLVLDTFEGDNFILSVPTGPTFDATSSTVVGGDFNGAATADVFGADREVTLDVGTSGGTAITAILPPSSGSLIFDTGSTAFGTSGAILDILYDDFTDVDVTGSSLFEAIEIQFSFVDKSAVLAFTFDDGVNTGTVAGAVSDGVTSGAQSVFLSLTDPGLTGVDLSSIDSIDFNITTSLAATDLVIDTVQFVIPEPSAAILLASTGLMMMVRRRRA
ncbi:MAG: PEP-CTERM sorting domain-containing protein [Planctomycetota bacterium]